MKEEPTPSSPSFRSHARDLRGQRPGIQIRVPAQRRLGSAEVRVQRDLLDLLKELQFEGVIDVIVAIWPHAHLETGAEVQVYA